MGERLRLLSMGCAYELNIELGDHSAVYADASANEIVDWFKRFPGL